MAKVLITGATGFIGNHVTRLCLEKGDSVRVMVMPGEDRSPLDGMDVEFVEGNLLDAESLQRAVQGVEQLYHLAAMFAIWTKDPDLHYKINVDGARAMMQAAKAAEVEKIVFTSSVAAIGIEGNGSWATEETPFHSWPWASEYILSKYISHERVKGMVSEGLPVTMVMPGLPFGPGDRDVVFIRPTDLSDPADLADPPNELQTWPVTDIEGWLDGLAGDVVVSEARQVSVGGREALTFDLSLGPDFECGPAWCAAFVHVRDIFGKTLEPDVSYRVWWVDGGDYEPVAVVVGGGPTGEDFFLEAETLLSTIAFSTPEPHPIPAGDG